MAFLDHSTAPFTRYFFTANAGYCEERLGNTEHGLEYTRKALAALEGVDEAWVPGARAWTCNQIAWSKFRSSDFEEAVQWARKGVGHNPEFGNAHGTLGSALYELGDDEAYTAFEEAMKLGVDPEKPVRLKDDVRYQALAAKYDIPLPTGD